jgi:hypothetical protein
MDGRSSKNLTQPIKEWHYWVPETPVIMNYREVHKIPDNYKVILYFRSTISDEDIVAICDKNDYLNPKANVEVHMVK